MPELLCAEQGPGNEGEQVKAPWCSLLAPLEQCRPERLQDCSASCSPSREGTWKVSPQRQACRTPMGKGTRGKGSARRHFAPVPCLGTPLADGGSSRQRPALSVCLPPRGWCCAAAGLGGACLRPFDTQLLSPSAHTSPLLVACTVFFTSACFSLDLAALFRQ